MLELLDKQIFYHGSHTVVEQIDLACCRPFKDFGQGFYVTTSKSQAEQFAFLSYSRAAQDAHSSKDLKPSVSTYTFALNTQLIFHAFEEFAKSDTYNRLFNFETHLWAESPDYLALLFEQEQSGI